MAGIDDRIARMRAQGKTESTSKKLAKLIRQRGNGGGRRSSTPNTQSIIDKQRGQEESFLKRFRSAITAQPRVQDIFSRRAAEEGLSPARELATRTTQQALDIEGELEALPGQVAGATRGFDVGARQLAQIQAEKAKPVREQLVQLSRAATRAGVRAEDISRRVQEQVSNEITQLGKELQPFSVEAAQISERAAREVTLFSIQLQENLTRDLDRLARGERFEMAELQRIADLASKEDAFQKALDLAKFSTDESIRKSRALKVGTTTSSPFGIFGSLDTGLGAGIFDNTSAINQALEAFGGQ